MRLQISQTATSTFFIFIQKQIRLYSNLKNSKAFTSMVSIYHATKHTADIYYTLTMGLNYSKTQQSDLYSDLSTNFTSSGLSLKKYQITKYPMILHLVDYM